MSGRSGRQRRRLPAADPDIDRALEAMTAPELRAAARAVLGALDEKTKASTIDTFVARATKGTSGWRPRRPSQRLVEQAQSFVEAASQLGYADPADATECLRRAMKAFLAGDHASARAVFEAILVPIAGVEIDLGQHELVEEVLVASGDAPVTVRATSKKALPRCPTKAGRQMGLLRTLVGDVTGAGALLSKAAGLGWSDPDHPGHTVFPLLATLLSTGAIGDALTDELDATARDV